jgi:hypothetical protein
MAARIEASLGHGAKAMANSAEKHHGPGWRIIGWGAAALLLLTPLLAMQVTEAVDWDAFDFVFMGALLGGVGLGLELALRRTVDPAYRAGAGVALAAAFLLIWMNAAVGIIGGEQEDANALYLAVPAVALLGALAARFRAAGLTWAMVAAALAQVCIPLLAARDPALRPLALSAQVAGLTGVFAALWLLSAGLFRRAARET